MWSSVTLVTEKSAAVVLLELKLFGCPHPHTNHSTMFLLSCISINFIEYGHSRFYVYFVMLDTSV